MYRIHLNHVDHQSMKFRNMSNKGTDQVWSFRDDVCGIDGGKSYEKCTITFAEHVKFNLILTCTEYTSTMLPVNGTQEYHY